MKLGSLVALAFFIAVILIAGCVSQNSAKTSLPSGEKSANEENTLDIAPSNLVGPDNFITASPVDLSQISYISKFRSCVGADYSGKNVEKQLESGRSMKHYFVVRNSLVQKNESATLFAPFDGRVIAIYPAKGYGESIVLEPFASRGWYFEFAHVESIPTLQKGSTFEAGEVVGNLLPTGPDSVFEISLNKPERGDYRQVYNVDSMFSHANTEISEQFEKRGINKDNIIVSKEFRDGHPCDFGNHDKVTDNESWVSVL